MLPIKRIAPRRRETLVEAARSHPRAVASAPYAGWYLHRWHLLPEGYMSDRGVELYTRLVVPLYYQLYEARVLAAVRKELRSANQILDMGCGPGRLLRTLHDSFPAARITGVDLSPYMLERAAALSPDGVRLVHADSSATPFPTESFDAVAALHHLGHVPAPVARAILHEAHRILRPGGRLLVVDHRWHDAPQGPFAEDRSRLLPPGLSRLRVLLKLPR